MWYLTSETDERVLYVVPNKDITIGRSVDAQVCNFALHDDASISRKHATLSTSNNNLYLQDMGSRYGTFVNDFTERIDSSSQVKLKSGDIVRFGKISNVWKVHENPLITCTSTLKGENLQTLRQCLSALGGVIKSEWDDSCLYLTMPGITLTIKVVLALAQGANIVTLQFWNKCLEAVENQKSLPDPANYIPQVVESTLNKENVTFKPNENRKNLFAGKTIIFFAKRQHDMYKDALVKCSASALLLSDTKMTKSALCDEKVIVIQYNSSNTSQETEAQRNQINDIVNYLKSNGKRVVADAEIGLAILYCCIDKYCNPNYNFSTDVIKQAPATSKSTNVLAQESQEPTQNLRKENVLINESLTPNTTKRRLDDDEEMKANKRFAPEKANTDINESNKRKMSDDTNQNPNKKMAVSNNDDDDIFNFLDNANTNKNEQNRTEQATLNFTKSVEKNHNSGNEEDDLFNFVNDNPNSSRENGSAGNSANATDNDAKPESRHGQKRKLEEEVVDIAAMRGSKLKELMENQSHMPAADFNNIKIKKEEPDELDQKMNDLDLGTTIVTINKNLIVKKEPIELEENTNAGNIKNFKKFKKVWPVRMQVTVVPKTTMSILIPDSVAEEITSQSY